VNELRIGSLFSGIGGIELGFERAGGFRTIWFVENEPYCQVVLKKHWPRVKVYGDITKIDWRNVERPDILTGGFPCQDISNAGKRKGIVAGERSALWKEYLKAICALRPKVALIENVAALAVRGLDVVLADLAEAGYDAEWFTLSAADVGAPHLRERLFIIAYSYGGGTVVERRNSNNQERYSKKEVQEPPNEFVGTDCADEICPLFVTNDWNERIQRFKQRSLQGKQGFSWCKGVRRIEDFFNQPNTPEPLFCGSRDGIPHWMDRIKCCGNAVVPQVAQFIAERIKEAEDLKEKKPK
jgi:DNA (cytosine-5)-methyltransferase 1